jgi:hypothetical protein
MNQKSLVSGIGMHILGLTIAKVFRVFLSFLFFVFMRRILPWLHDLDYFWFNSSRQQLLQVWLTNNISLILIKKYFFLNFNPRVFFLYLNLFWSNHDYWLIIVDVWCLIIVQWLISNMLMPLILLYLLGGFETHMVGFALNVLRVFKFSAFDPFWSKYFVFLCFFFTSLICFKFWSKLGFFLESN